MFVYLISTYSLFVMYMISKQDSRSVMKNVCNGPIFSSLISIEPLGGLRQETKSSHAPVISLARCIRCNFLIVSTFVTRCHHVQKEDKDPSALKVELSTRRLSCIFAEIII
jgi:hypothetical protein